MTYRFKWLSLPCVVVLLFVRVAVAADYQIDQDARNSVTFISDAPIEDITGVTSAIDGFVSWLADSLQEGTEFDSSEFYFEVELAGLKTGIGLRDRHLRENYLETEEFPYASLAGQIDSVRFVIDTAIVHVSGIFSIHGVEQPFGTVCSVTQSGTSYRVSSAFEIRLTDYNIEVPSLMFLKVNEVIEVRLDFYLRPMDPVE